MGSECLAVQTVNVGGILSAILILVLYAAIVSLIIIALVRLVRFLSTACKQMQLTRIEVGKLAEELHLLRKELKVTSEKNSSGETG